VPKAISSISDHQSTTSMATFDWKGTTSY